jgi:hypothetical protein
MRHLVLADQGGGIQPLEHFWNVKRCKGSNLVHHLGQTWRKARLDDWCQEMPPSDLDSKFCPHSSQVGGNRGVALWAPRGPVRWPVHVLLQARGEGAGVAVGQLAGAPEILRHMAQAKWGRREGRPGVDAALQGE